MRNVDVEHILDIYNKKDYSNDFIDYDLKYKRVKTLSLSSFTEFDFIKELINKDVKKIDETYEVSEFITLLKYEKGNFFREHTDKVSYTSTSANTILSAGYLLNDNYNGGNFIINSKKLNVGIGELFTFGRTEPHEVTDITDGVRLSIHFAINTTHQATSLI